MTGTLPSASAARLPQTPARGESPAEGSEQGPPPSAAALVNARPSSANPAVRLKKGQGPPVKWIARLEAKPAWVDRF